MWPSIILLTTAQAIRKRPFFYVSPEPRGPTEILAALVEEVALLRTQVRPALNLLPEGVKVILRLKAFGEASVAFNFAIPDQPEPPANRSHLQVVFRELSVPGPSSFTIANALSHRMTVRTRSVAAKSARQQLFLCGELVSDSEDHEPFESDMTFVSFCLDDSILPYVEFNRPLFEEVLRPKNLDMWLDITDERDNSTWMGRL